MSKTTGLPLGTDSIQQYIRNTERLLVFDKSRVDVAVSALQGISEAGCQAFKNHGSTIGSRGAVHGPGQTTTSPARW